MKFDFNFYPGWVRKSITFTIDDGNIPLDRKFLGIVQPAGLKGTFNLCSDHFSNLSAGEYRDFYRGNEISNHCKYHASPIHDDETYRFSDEKWKPEKPEQGTLYKTERAGRLIGHKVADYWDTVCTPEYFLRFADEGKEELEAAFGQGSVRGFVWPNGLQNNREVFESMLKKGYYGLRMTGNVKDSTGYSLPGDWAKWSYNANCHCLLEEGEKYESYPDDGELKFFCFGVHSHDFENAGKWDVLIRFCDLYGNRPETFYYATVGEIFDYQQAVASVFADGDLVCNHTDTDLYFTADGVRRILTAHSQIQF